MSFLDELIAADVAAASGGGADNRFIVTLTPTALDYSGTMDKTIAEIYEAWQAGKDIWFRLVTVEGTMYTRVNALWDNGSTYPSFNGFVINDSDHLLVAAFTGTQNDGTLNVYDTTIYTLTPLGS